VGSASLYASRFVRFAGGPDIGASVDHKSKKFDVMVLENCSGWVAKREVEGQGFTSVNAFANTIGQNVE
jgi:hypothetical protein